MRSLIAAIALVLSMTLPLGAGSALAAGKSDLAACLRKGEQPPMADPNLPPWGVVLVSDFSRKAALTDFYQMQKRHRRALRDVRPIIVPVCDLTRGTSLLYSVRVGQPDRKAADHFCKRLRKEGIACVVQTN